MSDFLSREIVRMEKTTKKEGFLKRLMRPSDLTTGKPWLVILKYAAPIILSQLLQQIYVLTDAAICGQVLSAEQVAGVNDTFPLTFMFLQFAFGCTGGFGVITAARVGRSDEKGVRASFVTQIYLSLIISAVLTVLSVATLPLMLRLINVTPDNAEVYSAAYDYCLIIFLGIVAQVGYNFVCGVLRAYGDSVTPLVFLIISTALNVGLDILFLVPLGMGPAGAAIATVLAQLISFVACLVYTLIRYEKLRIRKEDWRVSGKDVGEHLKQGVPLGLQYSVLAVGIIVMQGALVKFDICADGTMVPGTPAQNGFGAATKLNNFLMSLHNGLSVGMLGYNAQNFGKGEYERIKKGTVQALYIMLIVSAFCFVVGMLCSINGAYQYIFLSPDKINEQTIKFGNTYIYIDFAMYAVLGFLMVTRSAAQGVCRSGYVLGAGIAELVARVAGCAFLPVLVNGGAITASASLASYAALCFGDPLAWLAGSVAVAIPFFRNILRMKY